MNNEKLIKWRDFVKAYKTEHPELSYKMCLINCKELYHSGKSQQENTGSGIRIGFKPSSRNMLLKYGNSKILGITIVRKPVAKYVSGFVNVVGKPHDKLFHLFMLIKLEAQDEKWHTNKVVLIEKNEDINIGEYEPSKYDEYRHVKLNKITNMNLLLNNTVAHVGLDRVFKYDAFKQNCQVFVHDVLNSNGLLDAELDKFILQKVADLVPQWVKKLTYGVTSLKNQLNQVVDGQGMNKKC